jgi:hypothetical protein
MLVSVSQRIGAARDDREQRGKWSGALTVVLVVLFISLWVGVALFSLGVLLALLTGAGQVSLVIIGAGVLLIFVGLLARGYWP